MGMQSPFSEDVMTIILGLEDPMEPGMHGPMKEPCPTDDAVALVTKIRDMCDEWLRSAGKCDGNKEDKEHPLPEVDDTDKQGSEE